MATTQDRVDEEVLRHVDWERIERSPEFQELVRAKRRFVVPATIFFLAWYLGFILLCGYAEDFMAESVYEGLTVGYVLALTQFVMVAVLGVWYLRRADRVFDPLADKVARLAEEGDRTGRIERETRTAPTTERPS
jgi:uncharacterized membrane protein (DUF485 family)